MYFLSLQINIIVRHTLFLRALLSLLMFLLPKLMIHLLDLVVIVDIDVDWGEGDAHLLVRARDFLAGHLLSMMYLVLNLA